MNILQNLLDKVYPKTKDDLATEKLKNELYQEYCYLEEITPSLTQVQKYDLAKLTKMPEWKTFTYCLERYKAILFNKGTKHGESKDDLLVMKAQMKNVSVIGGFWKRFKNVQIPTGSLTPDDPASTISLD